MKTCPVCHLESQEDYQYCPEDGSSLWAQEPEVGAPAIHQVDKTPLDSKPPDDVTTAAVLYCPACANVYPLTFTNCPAHGVQLITRRVEVSPPRPPSRETELVTHNAIRSEEPEPVADHPSPASVQTVSNDNPNTPDVEDDQGAIPSNSPRVTSRIGGAFARASWLEFFKRGAPSEPGSRPTIRSHRVAAVVLIIGLAVFTVIAFSVIFAVIQHNRSRFSQNPPSPPRRNDPPLVADFGEQTAPTANQGNDSPPGADHATSNSATPKRRGNLRRAGIAIGGFGANVEPFKKRNALSLAFNIRLKKSTEQKPHIISVSMKPRSAKGKGNALKLPFPRALRFDAKGNAQWSSTVTIPAFKETDWRDGAKIVVAYYLYDPNDIQEATFTTNVTFQSRASHGRRADNRFSNTTIRRRSGAVGTL